MAFFSSATEKNFQTGEDMFTNDDITNATQAESHLHFRKADESQINQTDWFTSKRSLSDFIYLSEQ